MPLGVCLHRTFDIFHVSQLSTAGKEQLIPRCSCVNKTLTFSQMLGSVVVIVAIHTFTRNLLLPDLGLWDIGDWFEFIPFASVPFWVALGHRKGA